MEKVQRNEEETSTSESGEMENIGSETVLKSTEGIMKAAEGWLANQGAGDSIDSNDISSSIVTYKAPDLPDVLKEYDSASDIIQEVPRPHGAQSEMTSPKAEDYEPFQSSKYGASKDNEGLDAKSHGENSTSSEDREQTERYVEKDTVPTSSFEMSSYPDSKYVVNELPEDIVNGQGQEPALEKSLSFSDIMGYSPEQLENQQHPLIPALIDEEDKTMPRSVEDNVPYELVARKISNQSKERIEIMKTFEDSSQDVGNNPSNPSDIEELEGHSDLHDNTSETFMIVKDISRNLQGGTPLANTPEEILTGNDMLLASRAFSQEQLRTDADLDLETKGTYNVKSPLRAHLPSRQEAFSSLRTSLLITVICKADKTWI